MKYCNTNRVKGKLSRFCYTEQGYEYNAHATADQCKLNGNRTNERPKRQRARKKRKKLIYSSADYTHADDADSEHTTAEKKKRFLLNQSIYFGTTDTNYDKTTTNAIDWPR